MRFGLCCLFKQEGSLPGSMTSVSAFILTSLS